MGQGLWMDHRDKEGEDVFLMRLIPPRARGPAGLVTRTPFGTRAIVVFAAFTMKRVGDKDLVKRFPLYPLSYRARVARAGVEPATWSSVKM